MQCQKLSGGCPGANTGVNCWPSCFWPSDSLSGSNYYYHCLNSGSFNANSNTNPGAFSVRCVLDLNVETQNLQTKLCDSASGKGALQCSSKSSGCPGSNNNNCNPYRVWGTATAGGHYRGQLSSGSFDTSTPNSALYANGVRCVLDLKCNTKYKFKSIILFNNFAKGYGYSVLLVLK